jgi:membrane-associated phospholipid phosphatase
MLLTILPGVINWGENNSFDRWLIHKINNDWSNQLFDWYFLHGRETLFWMPLYLFLFLFIISNYGKKGLWWAFAVVVVAALSDVLSSTVVKELIFRVRPCRDPEIAGTLRFFINYCPQSSSFTSSHATSHFAQAWFFYLTLRHTGKYWGLVFLWAFLIAYGQVYVGVHYPSDVLGGALLGTGIGFLVSYIYKKRAGELH